MSLNTRQRLGWAPCTRRPVMTTCCFAGLRRRRGVFRNLKACTRRSMLCGHAPARSCGNARGALSWFRSRTVLDWIEIHAPHTNVTEDCGQLAALSDLSWSRVELWLSRGRPFSLIALDALTVFIPRPGQAPIVKMLEPRLKECPDRLTLTQALQACMAADAAPRVSGNVAT
jgi:hypothetical protein